MKKKIIRIGIVVLLIGISISLIREYRIKESMQMTGVDVLEDHFYDQYAWISDRFVKNTFTNEGDGIKEEESILTSLNLLYMEYLLNDNNRVGFEKVTHFVQENLLTEEGLVAFGAHINPENQNMEVIQKVAISDNLKLYKLFARAYLIWREPYYNDLAQEIAEKICLYNIKDGRLDLNYITEHGDEEEIALDELDLKGLAALSEHETIQKDVYQSTKKLLQNAYISNDFPLYYSNYNYKENSYIKSEKVDMLNSLLVVKELANNNSHKENTIKWLKKELKSGGIYEQYNAQKGIVTSHKERISIYAVVAQIGKAIGDIELYTLAMEKMLSFQVKDSRSEIYGAFQYKEENKVDCYENLQALLAF